MEAFFKTSFADVRVHVGSEASTIGALAFTHGADLYFATGHYNPQTPQGQRLLGHELTHVVQQRAGRVRNPFGSGVAVVRDPTLEAEAERMGLQAATAQVQPALSVQRKANASVPTPVSPHRPAKPGTMRSSGVIQRMICIPEESLDDFDLWHQVHNMLKRHPNEDVRILEDAKETVKPGDRLAIVAHGNAKKIGQYYDVNTLAYRLGKLNLPNDLKRIELISCQSGYGDEQSYAAALSKLLKFKHEIKGYRGMSYTTPEGRNRAEDVKIAKSRSVFDEVRHHFAQAISTQPNGLEELAKEGYVVKTGQNPLDAILEALQIDPGSFAHIKDEDQILNRIFELMEERKKKLVTTKSEGKQESVSTEKSPYDKFLDYFKEKVALIRTQFNDKLRPDLKPILIEVFEAYAKMLGPEVASSSGKSVHQPMAEGRVTFAKETGKMEIRPHKKI